MFDYQKLRKDLIVSEGYELKPYTDTVGKLTIGVGWNLSDNGLPEEIVEELLQRSMAQAVFDAAALIPSFPELSSNRQIALAEMSFNLGKSRLSQFKQMIKAIEDQNFALAAEQALNSKWAKQVGNRAKRIAKAIKEG